MAMALANHRDLRMAWSVISRHLELKTWESIPTQILGDQHQSCGSTMRRWPYFRNGASVDVFYVRAAPRALRAALDVPVFR